MRLYPYVACIGQPPGPAGHPPSTEGGLGEGLAEISVHGGGDYTDESSANAQFKVGAVFVRVDEL